jgi:uncharacterized Zn-binding protein involved in type VI secretion
MGQPAARLGDTTSHGTPLGPGPGCPTVLIGGLPAARQGDSVVEVGPPNSIAVGCATVMIG